MDKIKEISEAKKCLNEALDHLDTFFDEGAETLDYADHARMKISQALDLLARWGV